MLLEEKRLALPGDGCDTIVLLVDIGTLILMRFAYDLMGVFDDSSLWQVLRACSKEDVHIDKSLEEQENSCCIIWCWKSSEVILLFVCYGCGDNVGNRIDFDWYWYEVAGKKSCTKIMSIDCGC